MIELEKDRSPIVERVYKYEEKNFCEESRRLVRQLEQERTELVEYLLNIFEKNDSDFANRLLSMVESGIGCPKQILFFPYFSLCLKFIFFAEKKVFL